jgi:hypothetical protein
VVFPIHGRATHRIAGARAGAEPRRSKRENPYRQRWPFGFVLVSRPHRPGATEPARVEENDFRRENTMLWTIAVILFVLWALGLVTSYTIGGYIHILLVVAVIVVVIRLIQGRRVL